MISTACPESFSVYLILSSLNSKIPGSTSSLTQWFQNDTILERKNQDKPWGRNEIYLFLGGTRFEFWTNTILIDVFLYSPSENFPENYFQTGHGYLLATLLHTTHFIIPYIFRQEINTVFARVICAPEYYGHPNFLRKILDLFLLRVFQSPSYCSFTSNLTMFSLIIGYWIDNGIYSAFVMIIINLIIDKSRLCDKITIKYWQKYRILNYTRIKPKSRTPQKKSAYFAHPDFSAAKIEKSAQITWANTAVPW